jgi:hypothetical protein
MHSEINMHKHKFPFIISMLLMGALSLTAQLGKAPSVTAAPIAPLSLQRGKSGKFEFDFRVASGYHINSNHPRDEYLIPTSLALDPPSDIMITNLDYPQGEDRSFDFAPNEKINVYAGDVAITGIVRTTKSIAPGRYRVHGTLTYQACDNAACYPPKRLPVQFDVKVIRPPRPPRPNPAQSPSAR